MLVGMGRVIAFMDDFGHVRAERAREAQAAGCTKVLTRGAFVQELVSCTRSRCAPRAARRRDPQGATTAHIGDMQGRSNAAGADASSLECQRISDTGH
jgi:hypothetical protein